MKSISFIVFFMFVWLLSHAADYIAAFDSANANYKKGLYEEAIAGYKTVLGAGYESADVYFNMGNAYYKLGNISGAIINYERAKLLNSSDEDIDFNLRLAQQRTVDKIDEVPQFFLKTWLMGIRSTFNVNAWAIIAIIFFALFFLSVFLFLSSARIWVRKLFFWFGLILFFADAFSVYFTITSYQFHADSAFAVITEPMITTKSSPDESGTELFILHEGTKVEVIDRLDDWLEIKLADGNTGWLKSSSLEEI